MDRATLAALASSSRLTTESDVTDLAVAAEGKDSRGKRLVGRARGECVDRLTQIVVAGSTITATCGGRSEGVTYAVRVDVATGESECTCPYATAPRENGAAPSHPSRLCKHTLALMLYRVAELQTGGGRAAMAAAAADRRAAAGVAAPPPPPRPVAAAAPPRPPPAAVDGPSDASRAAARARLARSRGQRAGPPPAPPPPAPPPPARGVKREPPASLAQPPPAARPRVAPSDPILIEDDTPPASPRAPSPSAVPPPSARLARLPEQRAAATRALAGRDADAVLIATARAALDAAAAARAEAAGVGGGGQAQAQAPPPPAVAAPPPPPPPPAPPPQLPAQEPDTTRRKTMSLLDAMMDD